MRPPPSLLDFLPCDETRPRGKRGDEPRPRGKKGRRRARAPGCSDDQSLPDALVENINEAKDEPVPATAAKQAVATKPA